MKFEKYDARTSKKMAELRNQGSGIRQPVRSVTGASREDLKDRANFLYRKSSQILTAGHPLKDAKGAPTPAAMQFKRWAEKVPQNLEQVREIKAKAERLKKRYADKK